MPQEEVFIGCVVCPLCDHDVEVTMGETLLEAMWCHEYECSAILIEEPYHLAA